MTNTHEVFSQGKCFFGRIPNGNRPIADEPSKAIGAPTFKSRGDNVDIRCRIGTCEILVKLLDYLFAIVEAPIPSEDSAMGRNLGLVFEA